MIQNLIPRRIILRVRTENATYLKKYEKEKDRFYPFLRHGEGVRGRGTVNETAME